MWAYADNEKNKELDTVVPLPDGSDAPIENLSAGDTRETLGVFTRPYGKAKGQLTSIQYKSKEWSDRIQEGNQRQRDVWFLIDHQLWPTVGYGLCSLSAPWNHLDGCLRQKWWQLVPTGGLVCSAPHQIRDTSIGLYRTGCPHMGI